MSTGSAYLDTHWTADDAEGRRNPKEDSLNRIPSRIREYNYTPQSPMNPNINLGVQVTRLPSQNGNRQPIRWRSRRRNNKFSKDGDSRVSMINQQVKRPPGGSLPRHAPTRLQRCPTDKSNAHLDAVCRDTH